MREYNERGGAEMGKKTRYAERLHHASEAREKKMNIYCTSS